MAAGSAAVLSSFLLNLYIAAGVFLAFSFVRAKPWCRRFFAPRRFAKDLDLKPKRLPNGLLTWIYPIFTYKEEDIIDEAGLDCAIYLRILRFGLYLFFLLSLWCVVTVLPANLTSDEISRLLGQQGANNGTTVNGNVFRFTDFDRYSLSNVAPGSPKMWVHLISIHFVVLVTLWLLWRFNKESVLLRLMFLGNSKRGGPSHTVLVTDIPGIAEGVFKSGSKHKRPEGGAAGPGGKHDEPEANADDSATAARNGRTTAGTELKQQHRSPSAAGSAGSPAALAASTRPAAAPAVTSLGEAASCPFPLLLLPVSRPAAAGSETSRPYHNAMDSPLEIPRSAQSGGSSTTAASNAATPTRGAISGCGATATSAGLAPSYSRPSLLGSILGSRPSASRPEAAGGTRDPSATSCAPAIAAASNASGGFVRTSSGGNVSAADAAVARARGADSDDPSRYSATGGKLIQARMGLTSRELLQRLEVVANPEDVVLAVLPEWGIDTQPQPPSRRDTKRFKYDLGDQSLDAAYQAKQKIKAGLTPQQLVAQEFAMMYTPKNVAAVNMVMNTASLEPLTAEYNMIREQLEDYLDMLQLRLKLRRKMPHKQITVLGAMYGDWGKEHIGTKLFKKMDAVGFWLKRLRFLRERILEEQRVSNRRVAPSAFVTFIARMPQAVASNSLHHHDVNAWRVRNAPAPFEVVWTNLSMTTPTKSGRSYFLWVAFWMMTLFFMLPVTAIQALIEVPKLSKMPVLGKIVSAPGVRQILEAIVPGLALKIFLAVVPIILRFMAVLSGATSISEIDFGVVKRYFLFQVIVVFFGNIIAGSFFNQLNQWVKNPSSVIPTLGKSIPMTSTFFITYLLTNGLGVKSLAFIRLPGFVIFWILSKFAGSPRARQRMWMHQYTDNGTTVVDHTIALLIGLTFSCINPIVCLAALAYFLVTSVGEGYNNIYVFRRAYESAGRLWKTVYNQVMVGLYIMQLTMLGLLSIKRFAFALLMIPLLLFSVGCHLSTLTLFKRPWSVTSLHDAAELDMWEADRRRMELLEAARKEREMAARGCLLPQAAEEGAVLLLPPPVVSAAPATAAAGKSERRLREALCDENAALALWPEEQAEVADLYKNPCFKVQLDDLEAVEALANDLLPRLDILNKWAAKLKKHGKKPAPANGDGGGGTDTAAASIAEVAAVPPSGSNDSSGQQHAALEAPPPELTKYDGKLSPDGDDDSDP